MSGECCTGSEHLTVNDYFSISSKNETIESVAIEFDVAAIEFLVGVHPVIRPDRSDRSLALSNAPRDL